MKISRDSVVQALADQGESGLTMSRLASCLDAGKGDRGNLKKIVEALIRDGLVSAEGRRYQYVGAPGEKTDRKKRSKSAHRRKEASSSGPQAVGLIRVHPAGYGFVQRDDDFPDVFVPAKYRDSAMDGDRVLLYTWEGHKGTEGRVEEILSRGRAKLTGTVRRAGRAFYLEPDDPRIAADHGRVDLSGGAGGARVGQCVVIEITQYPDQSRSHLAGRVTKVLGDPEDPRTEVAKIIACADIPDEFPEDALAQASRTPQEVSTDDLTDRIDLRDRAFLTIDPETARDFDDALCVEDGPRGGTRVWVAVADVSHYVRPNDALDREALIRGVSVYLPDQVVPMLPFELSSGICSLNPEVDRCAMVVRLDFDGQGRIVDTGYAAAVIRSQARLDYPGVAAALAGDFRGSRARYRKWASALERLSGLAKAMRSRRRSRGTLELDIPEAKVVLDADDPRLVRDVVRSKGIEGVRQAYELVEEFMIAANEGVGAFFSERGVTTMWRVHAPPKEERLVELAEILGNFGITADPGEMCSPMGVRRVLGELEGIPEQSALSFMVLRALQQAVYDTVNVGHFGLASGEYLHFTSPIRRYPDLIVHRLLKRLLHSEGQAAGGSGVGPPMSDEQIAEVARETSGHERRAIGAEREAVSMYRAALMRDQIGETFSGRVSGVATFGVFIQLDDPFVEGMVKIENIGDDYYEFDSLALTLTGRRSGHTIRVADEVRVEVIGASIVKRAVEFQFVGGPVADFDRPKGERQGRKGRQGKPERGPKRSPRKRAGGTSSRPPKRSRKKRRR